MKQAIAGMLVVLLAGCGNGDGAQGGKIFEAAIEKIRGSDEDGASSDAPQTPAAPSALLTRAAVEAAGVAMVRARSTEQAGRSTFMAQTVHDGYVSYISRFGQMLTLNGSLITASRGIGTDLLSVTPDAADPLLRPTPLEEWPQAITRTYRFPGPGPGGLAIGVTCRYVPGKEREMEIVEIVHTGRQIEEICTDGRSTEFTNTHFAGLETGRVWRSVQWLGPDQGFVDLEIIEPFGDD